MHEHRKKSFQKAPLASPASLYALNSEFSSSHESERKNTRCAYLPSFSQNTELKVWMLLKGSIANRLEVYSDVYEMTKALLGIELFEMGLDRWMHFKNTNYRRIDILNMP